ncbi:MAG: hypothetical protein WAW41_06345, partial [Methylobacter sp.]
RWSVYHCIPTPERGNDAGFFRVFRAFRGQRVTAVNKRFKCRAIPVQIRHSPIAAAGNIVQIKRI